MNSPVTLDSLVEEAGVKLSRPGNGGWQSGKCPFHEDQTESLSVNLPNGTFKCHATSCGLNGSAVDWLMAGGMSKREALDAAKPRTDVKRDQTHYMFVGPQGKRQQTRYVPGFKGEHRTYRWKKGGPSPKLLVYPGVPEKDLAPDTLVWVEGARTAEAVAKAGYNAVGLATSDAPAKQVVDWISKTKRKKWVLWPDKDKAGWDAMLKLARMVPLQFEILMAMPLEMMNQAADAANVSAQVAQRIIRQAKPPENREFIERPDWAKAPDEPKKLVKAKDSEWVTDTKGKPLGVAAKNAETLLAKLGHSVRYDLFAKHMCVFDSSDAEGERIADWHWNRWFRQAQLRYAYSPQSEKFRSYVEDIAMERKFDPVKNYLDNCPKPSDEDQARSVLWSLGQNLGFPTDDKASVKCLVKMMCAAVRRIRKPGCEWKYVLTLIGPQNFRKSSALRALVPNQNWFAENFDFSLEHKTLCEIMEGKWIIECDELQGFTKAGISKVKGLISGQVNTYRPAYARETVNSPRTCVFVATHNKITFLSDSQNVRWWPVQLIRPCVPELIREYRDRIWGAANYLEPSEKLWLDDPEIEKVMLGRQVDSRYDDSWADRLANMTIDGLSTHEILKEMGVGDSRRNQLRLLKILQDQWGYTRSRRRTVHGTDGVKRRTRVWVAPVDGAGGTA